MLCRIKLPLLMMVLVVNVIGVSVGHAANWLSLQGVTNEPYPLIWGFIQPAYMKTSGSTLPVTGVGQVDQWAGQLALVNAIQPDLSSSQIFQVQRTRIGVRGALPDAEKISYFVLAEYGNNGITQPGGGAGKVTLSDATVTFSQIKGAKIRVGQMKVPMSEEVYQGIVTFNYINLTNMANQQLVERPLWTDGNSACVISYLGPPPAPQPSNVQYTQYCNGDAQTQFRSAVVAVRDIGVQIFDSFAHDGWEHSYAVLIGQGGANKDNRNSRLDKTVYISSEKIFGGKRAFRKGYKIYVWRTKGKRTIYDSAVLSAGGSSLQAAEREYDRTVRGFGGTLSMGKYRFWAEINSAKGMIFNGSKGGAVPGAVSNNGALVSQFWTAPTGESDGGYVDFGYRVAPKVELDIRYDWYNRVTNLTAADETEFVTWTLGAQYFFSRTTKATVNYEIRSVEFPNLAGSNPKNIITAETDNRLSAQVFLFF